MFTRKISDKYTRTHLVPFSKLKIAFTILAFYAFLNAFPADFPFRQLHNNKPRYHEDVHDLCRASGWLFIVNLFWYFFLILSVLFNQHFVERLWARRLILYPNFILSFVGVVLMIPLWLSYINHSERWFANLLGFLNGSILFVLCIYYFTIVHYSLEEGYRYGSSLILFTTIPFLLASLVICILEQQWYILAILISFGYFWSFGLLDCKAPIKTEHHILKC